MKKLAILLIIIAAFITAVIYALPGTLKTASEKALSETLQTQVTIDKIDLSVLEGEFMVNQLTIKDYPQFSENNLFVLNNLVFQLDPMSLFTSVISIKELTVKGINLNLKGSLNENSLKHLQYVLTLNNQKQAQEEVAHQEAAQAQGQTHDHASHELRLKIEQLNINDITLKAIVTKPMFLQERTLKINGLNIANIGGEKGVNVNNLIQSIVESVDITVTSKIAEEIPAQKVFEDAKKAVEKGLEHGKVKADELLKKYF